MKLRPVFVAIPAVLLASLSAHAAVFVQTVPFNLTASGTTSTSALVNSGDLTGTVAPFNPGFGTLTSFNVVWHLTYTLNCVNDASGTGTSSSISCGGTFYLNGTGYDGDGGGNGNGAAPNASYVVTFDLDHSNSFAVDQSGVSYSPALLAAVTGGSSFPVAYSSPTTPNLGHVSSWSASAVGSVQVSYNYTPVPEPLSAAMVGAGLVAVAVGFRRRQPVR
jgi:hypothetical protein